MPQTAWKSFAAHWQIWFCVAVAAWFALSASGLPDRASQISGIGTDRSTAATTPVNVSAGLNAKAQSFYIERSESGLVAKATIELSNDSGRELNFQTSRLVLTAPDGSAHSPTEVRPETVLVNQSVPVLATVSFPLTAQRSGTWTISYGDQQVFSGYPR